MILCGKTYVARIMWLGWCGQTCVARLVRPYQLRQKRVVRLVWPNLCDQTFQAIQVTPEEWSDLCGQTYQDIIVTPEESDRICLARLVCPDLKVIMGMPEESGQTCVAICVWPDFCGQTCLAKMVISRFIGPCKSWTDACFGITQFVTPNTHVFRHPGVQNRKQKQIFKKKKTVLVVWSQTCGKMA